MLLMYRHTNPIWFGELKSNFNTIRVVNFFRSLLSFYAASVLTSVYKQYALDMPCLNYKLLLSFICFLQKYSLIICFSSQLGNFSYRDLIIMKTTNYTWRIPKQTFQNILEGLTVLKSSFWLIDWLIDWVMLTIYIGSLWLFSLGPRQEITSDLKFTDTLIVENRQYILSHKIWSWKVVRCTQYRGLKSGYPLLGLSEML